MAVETGIATDHTDLHSKLINFLTSDPDLVSSNQQWSIAWQNGNESVLQGPGLGGSDEVLVGMRLNEDSLNGLYGITIKGLVGLIATATQYDHHINATPDGCQIFLEDEDMQYWFVANGRRFIAVVKVNTVYQILYGGFFLPYSPPNNYAYPLFVGGCSGEEGGLIPQDWRSTSAGHSNFVYPAYESFLSGGYNPSAKVLDPAGQWLLCSGVDYGDKAQVGMAPTEFFGGFNLNQSSNNQAYAYNGIRERMDVCIDGSYALTPVTLVQANPSDQTYGVLQGVYHVSGRGNSSENIITVDGVDHLVVQNCFRTEFGDYAAIALE